MGVVMIRIFFICIIYIAVVQTSLTACSQNVEVEKK